MAVRKEVEYATYKEKSHPTSSVPSLLLYFSYTDLVDGNIRASGRRTMPSFFRVFQKRPAESAVHHRVVGDPHSFRHGSVVEDAAEAHLFRVGRGGRGREMAVWKCTILSTVDEASTQQLTAYAFVEVS